ncbi:hypothetical protein M3Y94_00880800 [Aphelenchoides besseyi]|nr:hypothetical protein M3Y94_00880800 [Aphelenchoides besseyi]
MSCTPNFYPISGTPYKFALDIGIQLSQSIPGMSIEYDAPPKGSYDKASGSDQKDGLDGGWIAFIVLAVLNLLVVIGCCGYWFWYRPKHKDDKDEQPVQQAN